MPVRFQKTKKPQASDVSHIRIADEIREWIITQATRENRTFSNMVNQLLVEAKQQRTAR